MKYCILKNIFQLDDKKIEQIKYKFIGMEDGWLEPNYQIIELYRLLNKYGVDLINEESCCNSWTKRIRKKYVIRKIKKILARL